MLLLEFSLYPTDKGASVSQYVKGNLEVIDDSGLPYQLGPMGTCLEGEYDQVMAVVRACFERLTEQSDRVACQIKMDWRRGDQKRMQSKVETLKAMTGRDLST